MEERERGGRKDRKVFKSWPELTSFLPSTHHPLLREGFHLALSPLLVIPAWLDSSRRHSFENQAQLQAPSSHDVPSLGSPPSAPPPPPASSPTFRPISPPRSLKKGTSFPSSSTPSQPRYPPPLCLRSSPSFKRQLPPRSDSSPPLSPPRPRLPPLPPPPTPSPLLSSIHPPPESFDQRAKGGTRSP